MYDNLCEDGVMADSPGRREANKQATRAALLTAAKKLFAERGFDATTVRDIAAAAEVTERTFYRYFDGKEGLIGDEFQAWLRILGDAIRARPAGEPPVLAVSRGLTSVGRQAAAGGGPMPLWLFRAGSAVHGLRKPAPRPLLQLESVIADAILARAPGECAGDDPAEQFRARVISRVTVAAFRSAMIEYRENPAGDAGGAGTGQAAAAQRVEELVGAAFEITGESWRAAGQVAGGLG
jgi:AcrR family transcriptional regulator